MVMNTCLFLTFKSGGDVAAADLAQLTGFLRATPKLAKALLPAYPPDDGPFTAKDIAAIQRRAGKPSGTSVSSTLL